MLVLEEVTATIDDEKKKAREAIDSSRRKIDEAIESSKRKIDGYKKETDQAVSDAKSQRDQVSQLRAANKQYSVKVRSLFSLYSYLAIRSDICCVLFLLRGSSTS